jgi:hypothetical protein
MKETITYKSTHSLGDTGIHDVKCNVLNAVQSQEIIALKERIQQLEDAGDALSENSHPSRWDSPEAVARKLREQLNWNKAKDSQ